MKEMFNAKKFRFISIAILIVVVLFIINKNLTQTTDYNCYIERCKTDTNIINIKKMFMDSLRSWEEQKIYDVVISKQYGISKPSNIIFVNSKYDRFIVPIIEVRNSNYPEAPDAVEYWAGIKENGKWHMLDCIEVLGYPKEYEINGKVYMPYEATTEFRNKMLRKGYISKPITRTYESLNNQFLKNELLGFFKNNCEINDEAFYKYIDWDLETKKLSHQEFLNKKY